MNKKYNFLAGPGKFREKGQVDDREATEEDHGTLEAVDVTIQSGGWPIIEAIILRKKFPDNGGGKKKRCSIS